ncbi:MAG: type I methionyl aminopeptidase [Chloroflexi bacterium]|nr:type I methionyl aminopeptidase [Chloroflexota bacterium]
MAIVLKSKQELVLMRDAGRIVAEVLQTLRDIIQPGISTKDIDKIAHEAILARKATPSFLGYHGYPASVCTSVNEEVVHGIPGARILEEGDIISLDMGVIYQGFQGDSAITVGVGAISDQARKLLETTEGSLCAGITKARSGNRLGDIGAAVQEYAESRGFSVVRQYCGHGIGRNMHEDPQVPNYGLPGKGLMLRPGVTLALEPMINVGDWRTRVLSDGWTVVTTDGELSAHFEHTIAITTGEAEILTLL